MAAPISIADMSALPEGSSPVRVLVGCIRVASILPPAGLVVVAIAVAIPPAVLPAASDVIASTLHRRLQAGTFRTGLGPRCVQLQRARHIGCLDNNLCCIG